MNPLVSVIIPVYNAAKYLEEALNSVVNQSYNRLEVIVVNDGSTDKSMEVAEKFSSNATILSQGNRGPASARNQGIRNSNGSYVAFLDSDDIWNPNKLKKQVRHMENNPHLGFSYTDVSCFKSMAGEDINRRDFICRIKGNVFKNLFWSNFIINSSVMVKKKCLVEVGLFDTSPRLIGSEDYDLWLRLSREYELGLVPEILTKYRLREDSLLGDSYEKAFPLHVYIYHKFYDKFPDMEKKIKMNKKEALSDLYLRYAYRDYILGYKRRSLTKIISSLRYSLSKGIYALALVFMNKRNQKWKKILSNFSLWNKIITPSHE